MKMRRRELIVTSLAGMAATPVVRAQDFPSRPIRWIAPFAAGGNYDVTSRLVAESMTRRLGQTVFVDNRPGAGGIVGTEAAASAPADGHTVVMASVSVLFVAPYLAGKPSMLPLFAPISLLTTVPMAFVTRPDSRFADMKAVLAEAWAKPGTVTLGHPGNGTTNHVALLRFQANENVTFNVVPYRGSGPGLTDLMSGQIDLYIDQLTTSLPHVQSGKIKPLLVLSLERVPQLPDVPTPKDIGGTSWDAGSTAGLFARVETAKPVLSALNNAVVAALKEQSVAAKLAEVGSLVLPTSMDEFAAYIKNEEASISELMKAGVLKPS